MLHQLVTVALLGLFSLGARAFPASEAAATVSPACSFLDTSSTFSSNKDATIAEFPFHFEDGLLWVKVRVSGSDNDLNFLLDSGAAVSVVNLEVARKLGMPLGKKVMVEGVGAQVPGYWPQHLSANAGPITLPSAYLAVDLTALSGACERPVDGLIGADFFERRIVRIDFARETIQLLSCAPVMSPRQILPLKNRTGALLVAARINHGRKQWLRLDTGCATALQWVTSKSATKGQSQELAVGLASLPVELTKTSVQLGAFTFDSVSTGLHRKRIFPGEAGLLGNELLSRFAAVIVDARSAHLFLEQP